MTFITHRFRVSVVSDVRERVRDFRITFALYDNLYMNYLKKETIYMNYLKKGDNLYMNYLKKGDNLYMN
jgi:uncharacterized protein YozE (UPF0346 family)